MRRSSRYLIHLVLVAGAALFATACGRNIGIWGDGDNPPIRINLPPEAFCPDETWTSPGRSVSLVGFAQDDHGVAGFEWTVTEAPSGNTVEPEPKDGPTTTFTPDRTGDYTLTLTVRDREGLEASCTTKVHSVTGPPVAICPDDLTGDLDQPVVLPGNAYDDNAVVAYQWEIVDGPAGHAAWIQSPTEQVAFFWGDISGTYVIRLTVTDDEGQTGSCEFEVWVGGVPTAICPDDMVVPTRTTVPIHGDAIDDGTIVSWSWDVVDHNTDTDPAIGDENAQDATFWALRVGVYTMRLTVVDNDGLSGSCEFTIATTPTGPTAICMADFFMNPLTSTTLVADGEDDGSIVAYLWELVSAPSGSSAMPPAPADSPTPSFAPDVVGEYVVRLTVTDNDGNQDSCEFSILVTPGEGLRIELFWNPPENPMDTTDVDLHLLHPAAPAWFDGGNGLDCYYSNCNVSSGMWLDWDIPNFDPDDPHLDIDDVDGHGPENINIDEPVVGHAYTIGVHYFSDDGQGPSQVYVKVYCGTIDIDPVYEAGPKQLSAVGDWQQNEFWKVAEVTWNGFNCQINPIDQVVVTWQAQNSR